MLAEKAYIEKQIKSAQIAKARAERKPNAKAEIENINTTLNILTSILNILIQAEGKNEI
jgi:hypothetical protein